MLPAVASAGSVIKTLLLSGSFICSNSSQATNGFNVCKLRLMLIRATSALGNLFVNLFDIDIPALSIGIITAFSPTSFLDTAYVDNSSVKSPSNFAYSSPTTLKSK